jgi:hypothetical protein
VTLCVNLSFLCLLKGAVPRKGIVWQHVQPGARAPERRGVQREATYGASPGQLGAMPPGTLHAVIASPPYAGAGEVLGPHNGIDYSKTTGTGQRLTPGRGMYPYGASAGQLGAMPAGPPPQKEPV